MLTTGATQTFEVAPPLKMAISAPGEGDVDGLWASQVIPCGAALVLFQLTCVPDDTVMGLWKEKPIGADALLMTATDADAVDVVVPVLPAVVVPVVPDVVAPVLPAVVVPVVPEVVLPVVPDEIAPYDPPSPPQPTIP